MNVNSLTVLLMSSEARGKLKRYIENFSFIRWLKVNLVSIGILILTIALCYWIINGIGNEMILDYPVNSTYNGN